MVGPARSSAAMTWHWAAPSTRQVNSAQLTLSNAATCKVMQDGKGMAQGMAFNNFQPANSLHLFMAYDYNFTPA